MLNWIERFLQFEKPMGAGLVRAGYYFAVFVTLAWVFFKVTAGLGWLFLRGNLAQALVNWIGAPVIGVLVLISLRIASELLLKQWDYWEAAMSPIKGEVILDSAAKPDAPTDQSADG